MVTDARRNYAGSILPQVKVAPEGYQQILWLFGADHRITEVGTMNCFVFLTNALGRTSVCRWGDWRAD